MPRSCQDYLPAKMDKRVAIQSRSLASDGQGGFTETWATDATVWAYVRPYRGRERPQAGQTQTPVTHKITTRYRAGVTTKQRLLLDSRAFDVEEVINPDEADQFLEILAVEQQ